MNTYGHDASSKRGVQERSVWITPEKAFVTGEMAEKRFALPIVRVPRCIPSMIIGAAPHIFGQYFLDIQVRCCLYQQ